jgi:hypothetical protein
MQKPDAELRMAANTVRVEVLQFIKEHAEREGVTPPVELVVDTLIGKHSSIEGPDAEWHVEMAKSFLRECAEGFCKEFAADIDVGDDKPQ